MIARVLVIVYFVIGVIVALNHDYLGDGVSFTADGLWRIANFVLGAGFWPLTVLSSYEFHLPDALLKRA